MTECGTQVLEALNKVAETRIPLQAPLSIKTAIEKLSRLLNRSITLQPMHNDPVGEGSRASGGGRESSGQAQRDAGRVVWLPPCGPSLTGAGWLALERFSCGGD